jgi:hypothetical protein
MAQRKALLVAIDDYGHPANNLNSCIADSRTFETLLRSTFGFAEFRTLHDAQATVANMEDQLTWLFDSVGPEDRLVLHFSGHGYQTPHNGLLEEVLVLRDGFLFDDRLSSRTQAIPLGVLTVILDSCFSGGMEKIILVTDKGIEVGRPKRWTPLDAGLLEKEFTLLAPGTNVIFKPFGGAPAVTADQLAKEFRPADLRPLAAAGDAKALVLAPSSDEVGQLEMNGLLLAASMENETASAKTSQTNGLSAFTFAMVEALNATGPMVMSVDIMTSAQQRLKGLGFRQTPLLKEPANQVGLGSKSFLLLGASANNAKPIVDDGNAISSSVSNDLLVSRILESLQSALRKGQPMNATPVSVSPPPTPTYGGQPTPEVDKGLWNFVREKLEEQLPNIILAATKEYQPGVSVPPTNGNTQPNGVTDEKFWGIVGPVLINQLPNIINAVTKGYQPAVATPAHVPTTLGVQPSGVADEKFWGIVGPVLINQLPNIINAVTKS